MNRPTPEDYAQARALQRHAERRKHGTFHTRTLTYYHATPERNLASIREHGLLVGCSQGRIPATWLCTRTLIPWAVRHAQTRHKTPAVAVLAVRVSRRHCIRFGYGRWFIQVDVGPEDITF